MDHRISPPLRTLFRLPLLSDAAVLLLFTQGLVMVSGFFVAAIFTLMNFTLRHLTLGPWHST
jgi:hypothetical protein